MLLRMFLNTVTVLLNAGANIPFLYNGRSLLSIIATSPKSDNNSLVEGFLKYPKRDGFQKVIELFTIDGCFPSGEFAQLTDDEKTHIKNKINQYVDSCKTSNSGYEAVWEDAYIVLSKE
jgi:hypothetical protein